MHPRRAAAVAALTLTATMSAGAQGTSATASTRHSIWLAYGGDHPVSTRFGVVFDAQLRLTQDADHLRQILARPGVSLRIGEHVKLAAGYTVVGSHDDANDSLASHRPEHRAWASAALGHGVGSVTLSHRLRLEHRWLSGIRVDDAGTRLGETWVSAERARYSLRAAVPLAGSRRGLYAVLGDEMFASFGGYAGDMTFDQNRLSFAIGARAGGATRLEAGYMLQFSADDTGRFTERNHTLVLTVSSTARIR